VLKEEIITTVGRKGFGEHDQKSSSDGMICEKAVRLAALSASPPDNESQQIARKEWKGQNTELGPE
jgi:hypothetical protein